MGSATIMSKRANPSIRPKIHASRHGFTASFRVQRTGQCGDRWSDFPARSFAYPQEPIRPKQLWRKCTKYRGTIRKRRCKASPPRGLDIDRNGVVWTVLASGHLASFDRRKCKGPLNGPTATGQHCPEGWSLYQLPGPQFEGLKLAGSAEYPYYVWVDQFNTFGLGANVPIATGNGNDALLALLNGKFVVLRVPYPMGFFAKNVDGRIDDPNAGWK